ncbi:hypothetical protein H310_12564 [Aphanomyces invadans]|uniref:RING-type domain-containing protein n=1 Tax=Aphanomyces invadans TaxID=157072 RepID=A0A024THJ6_9STRA|nr:hypothetical protein H310_12564 [Aphanomyces invadans]ETV93528.1 hypothetical protein H310_12564 [Aphanomyces invadans]|eukprot:XP_008877870.1 hypothetical protein H310_12564 [Aphanomyces invadans]
MDTSARECDVCFEPVPLWDDHLATICNLSCPAVVCIDCARTYLQHFATSFVPGLAIKPRCPVCPNHMPLSRLGHVDTELADWITKLTYKATELRCSYCDQSTPLLGPDYPTPPTLFLTPSLKMKLPWLRRLVRKFVRYRISAAALHDYIMLAFGPSRPETSSLRPNSLAPVAKNILVVEHVLNLLDDPERRTTFGLLHFSRVRAVKSPCCSIRLCFECKSAFHHGMCKPLTNHAFNEVVTCPECSISLVRGDGCNSMTCVCSAEFSWSDRVEVAAVQHRAASMAALLQRPRGRDSMQRVVEFCRVLVWKRRFQTNVLRDVRTTVHATAWRRVVHYCKRLVWKTKFSAVLNRMVRACLLREFNQERQRRMAAASSLSKSTIVPTAMPKKLPHAVAGTSTVCAAMA